MAENDEVEVGWGDNPSDTAILLLAAARDVGVDVDVVKTTGRRSFMVPTKVHDAYVKGVQSSAAPEPEEPEEKPTPGKPAAKGAAKKSASKE